MLEQLLRRVVARRLGVLARRLLPVTAGGSAMPKATTSRARSVSPWRVGPSLLPDVEHCELDHLLRGHARRRARNGCVGHAEGKGSARPTLAIPHDVANVSSEADSSARPAPVSNHMVTHPLNFGTKHEASRWIALFYCPRVPQGAACHVGCRRSFSISKTPIFSLRSEVSVWWKAPTSTGS